MNLRPYQEEGVASVVEAHRRDPEAGVLLLMATGTGKTQAAVEVIRRTPGRALVLAHRDELIQQAVVRIEQMLGYEPDVEKAELHDGRQTDVCVASVQTLARPGRLARCRPGEFSLVVVDEVHHAAADSYLRILEHFPNARKLGLTATATRADGKRLGLEWDCVAYEYGLERAIGDGWLVPVRRKKVVVADLELDGIETRGGDFVQSQLEARILTQDAPIHEWAHGIREAAPGRKVLAFCPGVESSRLLAAILNQNGQEIAVHLDGEIEQNERRLQLARFRRGEFQILTNCALFLEGYDEPSIDCVAVCRPTKSHPLYVQMVGRGTRLHPGKKDLLVVDFVEASERFGLVTAVDLFADGEDPEVRRAAEQALDADDGIAVHDAIAQAKMVARERRDELDRAARERAVVRSRAQVVTFDIDDVCGFYRVNRHQVAAVSRRWGSKPLSPKQNALVAKIIGPEEAARIEPAEGKAILNGYFKRIEKGLCSMRQAKTLVKNGFSADTTFARAKVIIDALAANGWRLTGAQRAALSKEAQ